MFCAVEDCANPKSKNRYFSFPKDAKLCEKWALFCRRTDKINTKLEKICVKHFQADDFERDLPYELGVYSKPRPLKLKPNSVPSVHNKQEEEEEYLEIGYVEEQKAFSHGLESKKSRQAKAVAQRKQVVDALITEYDEQQHQLDNDSMGSDADEEDDLEELPVEEVVQVVVDAEAYLTALERENTNLRRENFKMKLAAAKDAATIDKLQKQLDKCKERHDELLDNLSKTFSKAQIQKLQSGKRLVWPKRDLRDSCVLYATSPSAYNMLLQKGYPLPSKRALQHWEATQRVRRDDDELHSCGTPAQIEEQLQQENTSQLIEVLDITHVDHNYVNNTIAEL
ncbi:52 kDa repressor of the inhibitor of the protein kinase-like isoform X2 [Drosophila novamexicana]|nr:52 kDa repressor of the inhibitor of the protein kinase-like isoform X2 [Drosophila novamexicana]